MVTVVQARLAVDSHCELGEGIVWDDREQALLWTDIERARLWRHEPRTGTTRSWRLPDRLGSFALCESGGLLLGLAKGLYLAEAPTGDGDTTLSLRRLAEVEGDRPLMRINDGRSDRAGNFVFGTLNEAADRAPIGCFYQYSMRHGLRPLDLGGVAIPNSIAFMPEGDAMFFCDTRRGQIMTCAYDAANARTGTPRVFAEVAAPASPDGSTVDSEGRLWNAYWGGGRVVCHARDGRVVHEVSVPATQPSCPAFGGARLDTLYVATAREGLSSAQIEREPNAGGVFEVRIDGVTGLREERFADA